MQRTFFGQVYHAGIHAIDTFFFITSFLVTLHIVRHLRYNPDVKAFVSKLPFIITKRLIHFSPAFYFVYLMYWQLGPLLINGGNFTGQFDRRFQDCDSNWWMDLLYVRNLMPTSRATMFGGFGECLNSSWYMDADLQVRPSVACLVQFPYLLFLCNDGCNLPSFAIRLRLRSSFS